MIAMGFAIFLAAAGLALLVLSFAAVGDNAWPAVVALFALSGAIIAIMVATSSMANPITQIGAAVLGALVLTFMGLALAVAYAGSEITSAFKEINSFVEESESFSKMATALDTLGTAFNNLNNAMSGTSGLVGGGLNMLTGGLFGKVMGATTKNPIQQMVESLQPLVDNADKLVPIFEGISALFKGTETDIGNVFTDMAIGLQKVYSVINKESESGIQIQHTLENLALIQTGTSAGSSGMGGIIKAISGLKQEITAQISISGEDVKKLFEDGVINVAAGL